MSSRQRTQKPPRRDTVGRVRLSTSRRWNATLPIGASIRPPLKASERFVGLSQSALQDLLPKSDHVTSLATDGVPEEHARVEPESQAHNQRGGTQQ